MKNQKQPEVLVEECIYQRSNGSYRVRVSGGSGDNRIKLKEKCAAGTHIDVLRAHRDRLRADLSKMLLIGVSLFTTAADVPTYLATAKLTKAARATRTQQLAWWVAQPAAVGAEVLSWELVKAEAAARKRGEDTPERGQLLGDIPRYLLNPARLRECLEKGFEPTDEDEDPTEFASTHNHYRLAMQQMFQVLDRDKPGTPNPFDSIETRPEPEPGEYGQDMRVVRMILENCKTKFGRHSGLTDLRLAVLAYVHITPDQLMRLDMPNCFHDDPDATLDDIDNGAISLTKPARRKGLKKRAVPPPKTISLNRYGAAAMRAYTAEPRAWGPYSPSSMTKKFTRGCAVTQAKLAAQGIIVDLTEMEVRHLKHSLATAATLASERRMNEDGTVNQSIGVMKSLDHKQKTTTAIYTQSAVEPVIRIANRMTSLWLVDLFKTPITPSPSKLKLVVNV